MKLIGVHAPLSHKWYAIGDELLIEGTYDLTKDLARLELAAGDINGFQLASLSENLIFG
jgi:uncharacterized cupin superfamily protein